MALPTKADLQTLDYTWRGLPFCRVEAKAGINTQSLDVTWRGLPFVAASASVGGLFVPCSLNGLGSGGARFHNPLG